MWYIDLHNIEYERINRFFIRVNEDKDNETYSIMCSTDFDEHRLMDCNSWDVAKGKLYDLVTNKIKHNRLIWNGEE